MSLNTHSLDLESGSSQYASVADTVPLSITGNLTIEAWVKMESQPGTDDTMAIASKFDTGSDQRSFAFQYTDIGGTKYLQMSICSDGITNTTGEKAQTLTNGTYYHVAAVFTAATNTVEFFVNGASIGTDTTVASSIFNGTAAFAVGMFSVTGSPSKFFDGLIDDLRVWNTARTSGQISANYFLELTGSETGLVGYWKFNNAYTDATANAATLTPSGSPVFSTTVGFWGSLEPSAFALTAVLPTPDVLIRQLPDSLSLTFFLPTPIRKGVGWDALSKHSATWTNQTKS